MNGMAWYGDNTHMPFCVNNNNNISSTDAQSKLLCAQFSFVRLHLIHSIIIIITMIDAMAYVDGKWWRMNEVINFVNNSGAMGFFLSLFLFISFRFLATFMYTVNGEPIQNIFILAIAANVLNEQKVCLLYVIQLSPMPFLHKFTYTIYEINWDSLSFCNVQQFMDHKTYRFFNSFLPVIRVMYGMQRVPRTETWDPRLDSK